MRLTRFTDLALRLLAHLAARPGRRCSVRQVAAERGVSPAHLEKVASELSRLGLVAATRGRTGGLRLAHPAGTIRIGSVVRALESADPVDCDDCCDRPVCRVPGVVGAAFDSFYASLDRHTIADLLPGSEVDAARAQPLDLGGFVGHVEDRQRQLVA